MINNLENSETIFYYQNNIQNSIYALTDDNGEIAESYTYDVYGKVKIYDEFGAEVQTSQIGNNYTFTGRRLDTETGLYYFRARYYNPELGRFISRDPLTFVDGMNMYVGYFAHRGTVDPTGEICPVVVVAVVVVLAVAAYNIYDYIDSVFDKADEFVDRNKELDKKIDDMFDNKYDKSTFDESNAIKQDGVDALKDAAYEGIKNVPSVYNGGFATDGAGAASSAINTGIGAVSDSMRGK